MLVGCVERRHIAVTGYTPVLQGQKVHRKMHPGQFAPRHWQIARHLGAPGQDHRIELGVEFSRRDMAARATPHAGWQCLAITHLDAGAKRHAFGTHLVNAPIDEAFFHLEVGNAIAQQTTDAIVLLEHHHRMTGTRQLLCGGQTGGAGADHRHALAGRYCGRRGLHPAFLPGFVDDGVFNRFDADRRFINAQSAGFFARRRTDAAGELGEIIGRMQGVDRALPVLAIHQNVEVRKDVVHRAAVHAKRYAAIHAARALHLRLCIAQMTDKFPVMLDPRAFRLGGLFDPREFQKAGYLAHESCPLDRC